MDDPVDVFVPYFFLLVFIYTMPGYNCSIKERMLYSASKSGVVEVLEQSGIEILKKVSALLQTSYSKISFRPVVFHLFLKLPFSTIFIFKLHFLLFLKLRSMLMKCWRFGKN